jgi:hypothetical protein
MVRRAAALGLFVAVLAGGLVPCGEPPPDVSAAPLAAASVSDDGAWCGRTEPPQLLPACPCGCEQRPHVAGVPVGVGLAVRTVLPRLILPPAPTSAPARPALRASAGVTRTPDPVPLFV